MITEDYVSFETAKLLKEKGFDEDINFWYNENGNEIFYQQKYDIMYNWRVRQGLEIYQCPTLQMAMKWLREVHKLHITILWDCGAYTGKNSFYYHINRIDNYEDKGYNKIGFNSYEQTAEEAIKYCLKNLITPSSIPEQ